MPRKPILALGLCDKKLLVWSRQFPLYEKKPIGAGDGIGTLVKAVSRIVKLDLLSVIESRSSSKEPSWHAVLQTMYLMYLCKETYLWTLLGPQEVGNRECVAIVS